MIKNLTLGIAVLFGCVTTALAQPYPNRPITVVVPFAAGGPIDTTTRIVTDKMKDILGQTFVIENVGGAAGSIAAARGAKAAPDGYTLITGIWGTHVANGAVYKLSYDVKDDFAPIGLISSNPILIVSSKKVQANSLKELIDWLKANPEKASQGTSGVGSVGHIAGAFFHSQTGTKFRFIPYRGLAPAMQDLVAGNIDLMFDTPATSLPQVKNGSIRAFAVTSAKRLPAAPDIPTVDEAGLAGFHISTWTALFAPKGTSKDVIATLNGALQKALADPAVRERLSAVGQEAYPPEQQTTEFLVKFQADEIAKWWPIIKGAGITAN